MRLSELSSEDRERLHAASWLPDVGPFVAFDRSWTLRTDDETLAELVTDLYADLLDDAIPSEAIGRQHATFRVIVHDGRERSLVSRDSQRIGGSSTPASTMASLVWGINRWVLDEGARSHLLLHAGGVVAADGTAVLLPAPSESGKSTLTTGLLDRGLSYLSDEAVAIADDGIVTGYAKPVSIDRGAWPVLTHHLPRGTAARTAYLSRQWQLRASKISDTAERGALGLVVFPRYAPGHGLSLTRLSPSESLLRAGNCTFSPGNGTRIERGQLLRLAEALAHVPAYELISDELAEACDVVLDLLEDLRARPCH